MKRILILSRGTVGTYMSSPGIRAYYMAQVAHGGRTRLLLLALILPFWVNEILRAFASRKTTGK